MADFDLVGGFNEEPYQQFDSQRTVNLYAELDAEAKKPKSLILRPGYASKLVLASGSIVRELFVAAGDLYAVSSSAIYRIDSAFNPTHINAAVPLNTSLGYIGIDANANKQVLFVDGANGYLYQSTVPSFAIITEPNFPTSPSACISFNGYFVVNKGGTNESRISNLNDGTNWTSTSGGPRRFELTYKPDVIVGYAALKGSLFVFGQRCGEVWNDLGAGGDVPFRRNNTLSMEYGCEAVGSIATGHGLLFWLARTEEGVGSVMMSQGAQPTPVSTRPLDERIQSYAKTDDAIGYIYRISGHTFYDLIFPTEGKCWSFDATTQLWFEKTLLSDGRYIANAHAFFAGIHLLGAYNSRTLYEMSADYTSDDGNPIHWTRITRHLSSPNYKRIQVNRVQIDTIKGNAASNGVDATPEIFFSVSRNGGVHFSYPERKTYTKSGVYNSRAVWWRQGISDDWVFKIEGYNREPLQILGGSIDYKELKS
jgi:hypothetical protein